MADEVMDTGAEVELEPLESAAETTESGTASETGQEPSADRSEAGETGEDVPAPQIYKAVKEALKAHDPNALRQVRKALHLMDEVKAKAPDGIGKLVERMELVNQLDDDPEDPEYVPGTRTFDEVVSNTIAERTFWREYDTQFQAGNPAIITQMLEANPESFQKLIPIALDKYAEVNPDGFSALVCRSAAGYFESAQIPLQFELLDMLLPKTSDDPGTQRIIQAFQAIKKTFNDIRGWAAKPVEPKAVAGGVAAKSESASQPSTLEERELRVRNVEWAGDVNPKSNSFAASEALRVFGQSKFTAPEIQQLQKAVKEEINARTAINGAYQKKIKGFLKANNRTAYAMAVESEHKKIITGAIKRLGDDILAKRQGTTKPKPSAPVQRPQNGNGSTQTDTRYELIAGPPRTQGLVVDHRRTERGMLEKNTCYVVGRKNPVKWRDK